MFLNRFRLVRVIEYISDTQQVESCEMYTITLLRWETDINIYCAQRMSTSIIRRSQFAHWECVLVEFQVHSVCNVTRLARITPRRCTLQPYLANYKRRDLSGHSARGTALLYDILCYKTAVSKHKEKDTVGIIMLVNSWFGFARDYRNTTKWDLFPGSSQ